MARLVDTVNWLTASALPNTCCVQLPIDYEHIRLDEREPEPLLLGTGCEKHLDLRLSRHDGCFDCTVSRLNTHTVDRLELLLGSQTWVHLQLGGAAAPKSPGIYYLCTILTLYCTNYYLNVCFYYLKWPK